MAHYAQIDENNIVINVIVAEQHVIDSGVLGEPSRFIQTSYNTRAGVHRDIFGRDVGGKPLRKNYASKGYTYDKKRDAFIPPKPPFKSWKLDEETCLWVPPKPMPNNSKTPWDWDEANQEWVEVPLPPGWTPK